MRAGFSVNGARRSLDLDSRTSLLDALRDRLGLAGSKKGRHHGQCGVCTVIVNGRRIDAASREAAGERQAARATAIGLRVVVDPDKLHLLAPLVGGGFGSRPGVSAVVVAAAPASRELGRPAGPLGAAPPPGVRADDPAQRDT